VKKKLHKSDFGLGDALDFFDALFESQVTEDSEVYSDFIHLIIK
jgi:hypothetical protein